MPFDCPSAAVETPAGHEVLQRALNPYSGLLPEALLQSDPRLLKRPDRDLEGLVEILSPDDDAEVADQYVRALITGYFVRNEASVSPLRRGN